MRLNFSGVDEDAIREGIRRIGEIVREQVALYGTLTGQVSPAAGAARSDRGGASGDRPGGDELAKVLPLPRKRAG
jgi:2-aminoadipate transaminase